MSHFPLPARSLGLLVAIAAVAVALTSRTVARELDVPYVPTPQAVVEKMLEMADIKDGDYLIDLGSGDGRIPVTAAKKYGIQALGVDLNPVRVQEANENAKREKVTDKVEFREEDLFKTDLSKATVITMYLLNSVNMKLRPELLKLKPGTRIVSHSFGMGNWQPDREETVEGRTVYMWIVPEVMPKLAPEENGF
jgi:cyclopropane fatty-acyl-phospholipid synthase-like methyltransferase